jgi:TPR repeat protein
MTTTISYTIAHDLTKLSNSHFAMVVNDYTEKIKQGDVESEYLLGILYLIAKPGQRDPLLALNWIESAAAKGYLQAQTELYEVHSKHQDFERNDSEAFKWCKCAAEQGDAESQNNLGTMYHQGRGVAQNNGQAIHWLMKASENGAIAAKINLGLIYALPGEFHNIDMMVQCLIGAAEDDHPTAMGFLARAYYSGFQGQCDVDYDAAQYWAQNAAQRDNVDGLVVLYSMYVNGHGVEQNNEYAFDYLRQATEQRGEAGCDQALHIMGMTYQEGRIVEQDLEMAAKYYEAASATVVEAQYALAMSLKNGVGVEENPNHAYLHFKSARDKGFAPASYELGLYYEEGKYVRQDFSTAASFYHEALSGNHLEAAYDLAFLYRQGLGVPKSLTTAHALIDLLIHHSDDSTETSQLHKVIELFVSEMSLEEYDAMTQRKYIHQHTSEPSNGHSVH